MVDKHRKKLQQEKEEVALAAVREAVPHVGIGVCVLALEGTSWEVDAAISLLRSFQTDKGPQLTAIQQKRAALQAAAVSAPASEPSSDDSGSDSDRKRSKRHKGSKGKKTKHKRQKSNKKSKRSSDKTKRKRNGSPGIEGVVKTGYGAYGIIREQDLFEKRSEFQAWAIDVKKVDIESMPKSEEKELFKSFVEDFNTATLPHEKYYNLDIYERKQAAKAARKAAANAQPTEKTAFQDEQDRRAELAEQRRVAEAERLRDAYNQLKFTAVGKADDMREQEYMRMQMQQAYRLGDTELAEKLKSRLKPDEPVWKDGVLQPPRPR